MKLFLSYAHVNIALVKPVVDALRLLGHDPWFDDALIGGKPWQDQLRDQIVAADAFLYLVTPEVIASEWCTWEFVTAVSFNKPIIPVLLTATKLPVYVSQLQFVDLTELNPASEAKLAIALNHAAPPTAMQASDIPNVPNTPAGKPARAEIVQTATVSGRNNINAQVGTNSGTININAPAPARTPLIVLGLLIIAGILVVLIIALLPADQRNNLLYKVALVPASPTATITPTYTATPTATFTPSNTPTVTPTFTPSNTPLAGPTAVIGKDSGELLVVFAKFKPDCDIKLAGCQLQDPYNEWTANLQEVTRRDSSVKARVLQIPIEIDDEAAAQAVSDQYQATIVIWGDVGAGVVRSNYTIKARWSQVAQTITNGTFKPTSDIDNTMQLYVSSAGGDTEYVLDAVAAQLAYFGSDRTAALPYLDKAIALAADPIRKDRALALGVDSLNFYEGYIYQSLKQDDQAIASYTSAITVNPNFAKAYNNRGNLYYAQKKYDLALADYNQAITLDPTYAQAYTNRGSLYAVQKQYPQALTDFNKAIMIDPKLTSAYTDRAGLYFLQQKVDLALADCQQAITIDPTFTPSYLTRGTIYLAQKQPEQALADFSKVISLDPTNAQAYYDRGVVYFNQKQTDQALTDFNKAITIDPNNPQAYFGRGTALQSTGQYADAINDFQQYDTLTNSSAASATIAQLQGLIDAQNVTPTDIPTDIPTDMPTDAATAAATQIATQIATQGVAPTACIGAANCVQ